MWSTFTVLVLNYFSTVLPDKDPYTLATQKGVAGRDISPDVTPPSSGRKRGLFVNNRVYDS